MAPTSIECDYLTKWINDMDEELTFMDQTQEVWDLIELPKQCKKVGCKTRLVFNVYEERWRRL